MEANIQSKKYGAVQKPFVRRDLFKGGFKDLTQTAVDIEIWLESHPYKCAIDYRKSTGVSGEGK